MMDKKISKSNRDNLYRGGAREWVRNKSEKGKESN